MANTDKLFLIHGPSGSGKDTLGNLCGLRSIMSFTLRGPREYEKDGVHYHFLTHSEYLEYKITGQVAEETIYAGNGVIYGILKQDIDRALESQQDSYVICNIDGFDQLYRFYKNKMCSIVIFVTIDLLELRLKERGETNDEIRNRLRNYDTEYSELIKRADFIIDNTRSVDLSLNALRSIMSNVKQSTSMYASEKYYIDNSTGKLLTVFTQEEDGSLPSKLDSSWLLNRRVKVVRL